MSTTQYRAEDALRVVFLGEDRWLDSSPLHFAPFKTLDLSADEEARLLTIEFAFVKTDAADGMSKARERATWIQQAPARVFLGRHEEAVEGARRLKNLTAGEALAIEFGDAPRAGRGASSSSRRADQPRVRLQGRGGRVKRPRRTLCSGLNRETVLF